MSKVHDIKSWNKLCADLIAPYKIHRKGGTDLILKYIELIDIIMGGFEIII